MADDWAIKVDGLGKEYRIAASRGGYTALRDVLAQGAGRLARRLTGRGTPAAPTHEPFWALRDVSFEVPRGECVGVIGRNGAGKSTLLKILSRITEPTEGEIRLRGRVGSLLEVGTGFHPELTGRENVFLNGAILGMTRKEIARKFDEIVAFAEVEKFLDTPVKYYSSGMYTRLAFGVAAHLEPEILIVDEVLAVGDAEFQKKCLGKMGEVAKGGRTVLFVSHQLGQIRTLCDKCILLNAGQIAEIGSSHEVTESYLTKGYHASELDVDLETPRRAIPICGAKLTRLLINHSRPVMHGEHLDMHFYYRADRFVSQAVIGFGFSTLDGTRIYSVDSDLANQRFDFDGSSTGEVTLTIDSLPLQPGLYSLDVGIRSGDLAPVDYVPGCARVEVIPGPATPTSIIRLDATGCVRESPDDVVWTRG